MMKKTVYSLVCLFLIMGAAKAQDDEFRTLFQRNDDEKEQLRISGFAGPLMKFTAIENDFVHMMGGGAGLLLNDFFFGGYGYGSTTDIPYKNEEDDYTLSIGYGGLWFGYILKPYRPLHFTLSTQVGWGALSQYVKDSWDEDATPYNTESIFVLTPVLEVEMNFSRFFRLGLGGSVNYVTGNGITQTAYTTSDFLKPTVFMSFKFGYFY